MSLMSHQTLTFLASDKPFHLNSPTKHFPGVTEQVESIVITRSPARKYTILEHNQEGEGAPRLLLDKSHFLNPMTRMREPALIVLLTVSGSLALTAEVSKQCIEPRKGRKQSERKQEPVKLPWHGRAKI